jgi:hypothetical protein
MNKNALVDKLIELRKKYFDIDDMAKYQSQNLQSSSMKRNTKPSPQ